MHCLLRSPRVYYYYYYYCLPLNAGCDRDDLCQRASFLENGSGCPVAFSIATAAASFVARLQIQHISVLRTGIEQALFGRKIPRMMMMMVVTMMMMVVVVSLAERASTVDGGELAADIATVIQVSVAPLGATVTTTAEATAAQAGSTEDTAGETATVL